MTTDYSKALEHGWPDAEWSCGETYDSIVMLDATPKPTEAQLDQAYADYRAEQEALAYRQARKIDYTKEMSPEGEPLESIGDPLDEVIQQLADTVPAGSRRAGFQALIDKIAAIKARHPPPSP